MPESWAPGLDDVARHIPLRTRDTRTPSSDQMLGTFTESTTPTAEQAQSVIDDAVAALVATFGDLPTVLPDGDPLAQTARAAAEWRAAADIEVAYPNRDADIRVYASLDLRATAARADLAAALKAAGEGTVDVFLQWAAPAPALWADIDL